MRAISEFRSEVEARDTLNFLAFLFGGRSSGSAKFEFTSVDGKKFYIYMTEKPIGSTRNRIYRLVAEEKDEIEVSGWF